MSPRFLPIAPIMALVLLAGCSAIGLPVGPSARLGVGAPTDGLVGGGIAGAELGALAPEDRRRALAAEFRALEFGTVGEAVAWRGRGGSGEALALAPFQVGSQNCRQLRHALLIGGERRVALGAACREPDGRWIPLD